MHARARWYSFVLFLCALAAPLAAQSKVTVEAMLVPATAKPGDEVELVLTAKVALGFHAYGTKEPTNLPVKLAKKNLQLGGLECVGEAKVPDGMKRTVFGIDTYPLPSTFKVTQKLKVPAGFAGAEAIVAGALDYQVCDENMCLAPSKESFTVKLAIDGGAAGNAVAKPYTPGDVVSSTPPAPIKQEPKPVRGDEPVVRVRSLVPFLAMDRIAERHTALPPDFVDQPLRLDHVAEALAPTWVVELLQERHRQAIEAAHLSIRQGGSTMASPTADGVAERGNSVVLRGRAAEVEACCRDLDAMAAVVARPIEVTAWRLPLAEGALPPTTWQASTLRSALQRTPPLWTARACVASGAALRLAQERVLGHVRDVDVEAAKKAKIYDPKIDLVFAGVRASVVVHALPGEQLLLSGSWLLSDPVALHDQPTGDGELAIELPEHRTAWVTFAGRVPSGGALAVAGRGAGVGPDGFLLVLGARYLAPPAEGLAPELLVRPVGAVLAHPGMVRPQLGWCGPGDDGEGFMRLRRDGGLTPPDLRELLGFVEPAGGYLNGDVLGFVGEAAEARRIDAVLQQLFAALRTVSLLSRVGVDGAPSLEVVQPCLADRAAGAFLGRERAVLRDQEVEIAEGSTVPNPVVDVVRTGMWFGATAAEVGANWHVDGCWTLAALDSLRERRIAAVPPMVVQLVDLRTTSLPWASAMAPGQAHVLGDGVAWQASAPVPRVSVQLSVP